MSLSTTLIGLLFLFLFIGPILYSLIKLKIDKKSIQKKIDGLCGFHGVQPSETFIIYDHYFFVDLSNGKLFHIELNKTDIKQKNLWKIENIKSCRVDVEQYMSPSNIPIISHVFIVIESINEGIKNIMTYNEEIGNLREVRIYKQKSDMLAQHIKSLLK